MTTYPLRRCSSNMSCPPTRYSDTASSYQILTADRTVVDRNEGLRNWVEIFKSRVASKKGLKLFAFANNHFLETVRQRSSYSGICGRSSSSRNARIEQMPGGPIPALY